MTEQHGQEPTEAKFWNAPIVRGREPIEHIVVDARAINTSGLSQALDYVVMLHSMFLMEEWHQWRARAGYDQEPEPEFNEYVVWRELTERGILGASGEPVNQQEVAASLRRVAAAGVVRGLHIAGGEA